MFVSSGSHVPSPHCDGATQQGSPVSPTPSGQLASQAGADSGFVMTRYISLLLDSSRRAVRRAAVSPMARRKRSSFMKTFVFVVIMAGCSIVSTPNDDDDGLTL